MLQPSRRFTTTALLALAAAALPGSPARAAAPDPFWVEAERGPAQERPESFATLAEALSPAVVNIQVRRELDLGGRLPHPIPASASGFVISLDGYIITNNHVVEEADDLKVGFLDGTLLPGRVVGKDSETDLALLKVESAKPLPVAPLGDSSEARVGDWVVAIGNPLGLEHTVTVGILSAKGRRVSGKYDDYLQTDASINPGNSGGPLIDTRGRVIGINTMIRVYEQGATGIAFAIPINMAKGLLTQLRREGHVTRGYLGIQFQPLTDALARGFGLKSTEGALVGDVLPGTPADKAAIRSGDVIVEFDGQKIQSAQDLPRHVASVSPGTGVDLVVVRSGKTRKLRAVVGAVPDAEEVARVVPAPESRDSVAPSGWGFEVSTLDATAEGGAGVPVTGGPLVVTRVEPDGPAARAGLEPKDVILQVNGQAVRSEAELLRALEGEPVPVLQTRRGENTIYRALEKD
jgi:serine protease Do